MYRSRKVYIDTSGDKLFDGVRPILFLGFMIACVIIVSCILVNAHNRARQDLIETMTLERQMRETHQKLASDMAGVTRSRLLTLKAKERLGLTKPKDEEVLVLK